MAEALLTPQRVEWIDAINKERSSLVDKDVHRDEVRKLPVGRKLIPTKLRHIGGSSGASKSGRSSPIWIRIGVICTWLRLETSSTFTEPQTSNLWISSPMATLTPTGPDVLTIENLPKIPQDPPCLYLPFARRSDQLESETEPNSLLKLSRSRILRAFRRYKGSS